MIKKGHARNQKLTKLNAKDDTGKKHKEKPQKQKPPKKDIKFVTNDDSDSKHPKLKKAIRLGVIHFLLVVVFASFSLFAIQFIVANVLTFLDTSMQQLDTQTDPLIFMTVVACISSVLAGGFIYIVIPKLYKLSLLGIRKARDAFTKKS